MVLTSKDLLQINATIIAGLLILLTISVTIIPGIPFLIDIGDSRSQVEMYEQVMNATNLDPVLFDHMKNRHAELKLEVMEKEALLQRDYEVWMIKFFYNPIATFTVSLGFFVISSMIELTSSLKNEKPSKIAIGFTDGGLIVMIASIAMFVIIPLFGIL